MSSLASARTFAMASVAYADAVTSVFEAKYYYDYWRPVTAIRDAANDGNPDTMADPDWHALVFTPPFPSYSSAATGTAAAVDGVLEGISSGPVITLAMDVGSFRSRFFWGVEDRPGFEAALTV